MIDPVSAFGIFTGAAQVVQVIGQTIAGLASLRGKYKNADLIIPSLIGELTTIKAAITQLHDWATYNTTQSSSRNYEYDKGLDVALDGCQAIMEVLSEEVSAMTQSTTGEDSTVLGFKARVKLIWNDEVMRGLEDRLHAQVRALNLLLQACQCRSSSEQIELLRKLESRRIIQKVADDTATLRSRSSSVVGSQVDSHSISKCLSSVGETDFDFDDALVSTDAYRRALQHSLSKPEANAAIVPGPSRSRAVASSDEGYASHHSGTPTPALSLSTSTSSGRGHPLRPNDSVLPEHGRSKSVTFSTRPAHQLDPSVRRRQSANSASLGTPSPTGSKREKLRSAFRRLSTSSRANLTASARSPPVSPSVGSTRGRRGRESDFNTSIDLASLDGAGAPLIVKAAQSGSRFDVERLIESGHEIEARHLRSRRNALMVAAHCGKDDIVDLLIQNNAALNASDASGSTALHLAASRGHLPVLEILLTEAVDLEAKTALGRTALWVAANNGQVGAVQLLLANHAKVNARADNQMTPLHVAAKQGDVEIASLVISQGADVDARDAAMMTALHYACEGGHLPVIELLLGNKANIDAPGSERRTPLICAAATGQLSAVQMLVKRKAAFRCLDEGGMTALHWAAFNGHVEIVQLFSEKRTALTMANIQGRTALHLAAMSSQFAVVEYLARKNPRLDIRCQSGLNPLHYACIADNSEVARLLLTSGADVEAQVEGTQQRPIHIAAAGRSVHLLNLLFEKRASLDSRDAEGDRALCVACRHGHVAAVQKLLDYGSPLNLRFGARFHEDSPLCLAAKGGYLSVVSLLISRGASVLTKDEVGWQPMRYAAYYGHPEVLEVLLSCTASFGGTHNGSAADIFGLCAERIGFAPDAGISEERKRRVLDLLNQAQRQQAPITSQAAGPVTSSSRVMDPTINQGSAYRHSSSASSSFPLLAFASPPQELPSTLEHGLPSSRSTTPDRMHRRDLGPETEEYIRPSNSAVRAAQGRVLPVLQGYSTRSPPEYLSTLLADLAREDRNVDGVPSEQQLLPQQSILGPTSTEYQAGPSSVQPQLEHEDNDTNESPSQDGKYQTSPRATSSDDDRNDPSLGSGSSPLSSSFSTPQYAPIELATTSNPLLESSSAGGRTASPAESQAQSQPPEVAGRENIGQRTDSEPPTNNPNPSQTHNHDNSRTTFSHSRSTSF